MQHWILDFYNFVLNIIEMFFQRKRYLFKEPVQLCRIYLLHS